MLTPRQRQLLDFIVGFQAESGYSPSFREMADGIGTASTGEVARLLACLEARGAIAGRNCPHGIRGSITINRAFVRPVIVGTYRALTPETCDCGLDYITEDPKEQSCDVCRRRAA